MDKTLVNDESTALTFGRYAKSTAKAAAIVVTPLAASLIWRRIKSLPNPLLSLPTSWPLSAILAVAAASFGSLLAYSSLDAIGRPRHATRTR